MSEKTEAAGLDLYDLLIGIASVYDPHDLRSDGHRLLRSAEEMLTPLLPGGLLVRTGGGKGVATLTPWIAVLDPDETTSPQDGMYLVYLFHAGLDQVTLSLNQGVTRRSEIEGWKNARAALESDASAIRDALKASGLSAGLESSLALGDRGKRAHAYEAGNILSLTYQIDGLPSEPDLWADLQRFLGLYDAALQVKVDLMLGHPGSISLPVGTLPPVREFKPKSSGDYQQVLDGGSITKGRRHELLVLEYGLWLKSRGLLPWTNEHPIDMAVEDSAGESWIIEAKVIRNGDAATAVRGAIGQLLEYAFFVRKNSHPRMLALLSQGVDQGYVDLLESIGIGVVWKGELDWEGSPSAHAAELG